jgi:Fe-S-cluster containining protein
MKKLASAAPMGVTGKEMEARRAARLATAGILKTGRTPLHISEVAGQAVTVADDATRAAMISDPPHAPSACREGCAWCCHKQVGVAAPEILRIVTHLQQTMAPNELEALRDRVARLNDQRQKSPSRTRSGIPCALLVDNRCSVYPVRPLTCRGFNSTNAQRCELSLDPRNGAVVPAYAPQQRLATLVLDGMRSGLTESGCSGALLELTAALHIALTAPDALDQWREGKPAFNGARLT